MKNSLIKILIVCLLILVAVQCIVSMQKKSVTTDEIMYIAAGYYHLKTGDFQFNVTNTPLIKLLSALPLLPLHLKMPTVDGKVKASNMIEQWKYSRSFLYDNKVDADRILFFARLPIVLLSLILGVFVFLWSKELYGDKAGIFALFLYSFSPNILAHSRLATHDLGLTAFMFISCYFFWKYISHQGRKHLILCGIFFGLAMLAKSTALFLFPIFVIYSLFCVIRKNGLGVYETFPIIGRIGPHRVRTRQFTSLGFSLLVVGLLGLLTLNIGYGFQGSFKTISKDHRADIYKKLPLKNIMPKAIYDVLLAIPVPVPSSCVRLLVNQYQIAQAKNMYFAGHIYDSGLWYATPAALLLKTPIPLLILLTILAASLIKQRKQLEAEWLMVIFAIVIISIFSYLRTFNAPLRYILPIYPFLHVFASGIFASDFIRLKLSRRLILLLSAWYVFGTISIHPHYLAYFNEFVGGPENGYKYLADSNLDWGQDLKGLKKYMQKHKINKIKLAYFGSADAKYYGINYDYLPSVGLRPQKPGQYWWYEMDANHKTRIEPQEGVIAVSATLLASPGWMTRLFRNTYDWLREYEPVDNVGYSILIYNID